MADKRGNKTGGRKKGTPNKLTADIKAAIEQAFNDVGGAEYLVQQARENPNAFLTLVGKILPKEINADISATLKQLPAGVDEFV